NLGIFALEGVDQRDAMPAGKGDAFPVAERLVAQLDRVAERNPVMVARQELEKCGELVGVELARRGELPVDRTELVAQRGDAAVEKAADRIAGLGEVPAMGGIARPLEGEDEILRRFVAPAREALRFLRAVE